MTDLPTPTSDPRVVDDLLTSEHYGSVTDLSETAYAGLEEVHRTRLATLADRLVSGGAGFPSASAADVPTTWIDRALAARPDLVKLVKRVLELEGSPQAVLDHLRVEEPAVFADFTFVVCAAYLINPRIRKLFGYPAGQPVKNTAFPDEADAYLEDGILDAVVARRDLYRPTPRSSS